MCICKALKLSKGIHNNTYGYVSMIDGNLMSAIDKRCDVLNTPSKLKIILMDKHDNLTQNVSMCRY